MARITLSTVVKLLVASLLVGMVMAFTGVTPADILRWVSDGAERVVQNAGAWIGWAVSYVLLGAAVVVPIWLIWLLIGFLRRR
ncbi:MAG: DUF6460 domain-containing protein [Geminicoccaceae bacterium]